jgi:hypothetical protein
LSGRINIGTETDAGKLYGFEPIVGEEGRLWNESELEAGVNSVPGTKLVADRKWPREDKGLWRFRGRIVGDMNGLEAAMVPDNTQPTDQNPGGGG